MLQVKNISKRFDGLQAVSDVTLTIAAGKVTSIIGPNGAGKTTLFNIVTGFLPADSGTVLYADRQITGLAPWRITRLGIARTFQDLRLFRKMTVLQNVLTAIPSQPGEQFANALFLFSAKSAGHTKNRQSAMAWLEFVGLADKADDLAENLSYGQQKLLSLACCLALDPKIILLDEPVAGVQPAMIEKIEELTRTLVTRNKKTIVIIEHNMDFVLRVSDTVVVMDEGKLVIEGPPLEISSHPEVLEAYLS